MRLRYGELLGIDRTVKPAFGWQRPADFLRGFQAGRLSEQSCIAFRKCVIEGSEVDAPERDFKHAPCDKVAKVRFPDAKQLGRLAVVNETPPTGV